MRKGRLFTGIIAVALALVLLGSFTVACTQPAPAPAPQPATPAPTPAPPPAPASPQTYNLKFSGFMPPTDTMELTPIWWGQEIEKRTNGKVKLTLYHAEALGKQLDMPDMVTGGVADIATLSLSIAPKFPMSGVFDLPFLAPSQAAAMETFYFLLHGGLLKELDGYKVLWFQPTDPAFILFRDKKVTKIDEFKGMKIRGLPGMRTKFPESLGATGVSMPTSEVYMALDRGIVDGMTTTANYIIMAKINEVAKYVLYQPFDTGGVAISMNLNLWNSLPGDIKAIIDQLNEEAKYRYAKMVMKTPEAIVANLQKAGFEVYTMPPDQQALYYSIPTKLVDDWITEMKAKGLPAQEVVDLAKWVYDVQRQRSQ